MTVGVGVVGLGFMGRTHLAAYAWAAGSGEACRVVGVCDADPARLGGSGPSGNLEAGRGEGPDLRGVAATSSLEALLALPGLDAVSVCTPTDTHAAVAAAALRAGKHVLVEKPVALTSGAVSALDAEARLAGRVCMAAMCMRYWPAWAWVRTAIAEGRYGRVLSARFERLGAPPDWSPGFYADEARCGGALFDLHVHDTDFVVHALGMPEAVVSVGERRHLTTVYRIPGGPGHVVARGGWLSSPGCGFTMRMLVEFESAVADFELGREPELVVHTGGGPPHTPALEPISGWQGEVRAFVRAVQDGTGSATSTLGEAAQVTRVLEAEARSLRVGGECPVDPADRPQAP